MQRFMVVDCFENKVVKYNEIMHSSAREFLDDKNIPIIENITAEIYSRLKQYLSNNLQLGK